MLFSRRRRKTIVISPAKLGATCEVVLKELWKPNEFTDIEKSAILLCNSRMNSKFRVRVLNSIRNHIAYKNRSNLSYKRKGVSAQQKQALMAKKKSCYISPAITEIEEMPANDAALTLQRLQSQVSNNDNNNRLSESFSQMMGSFTL